MAEHKELLFEFIIKAGKFLGFVLAAYILLKLILFFVEKVLRKINPEKVVNKINESEAFGKKKIEIDLVKICIPIVRWFLILIFVTVGSEQLELNFVSSGISKVIAFLPQLFTAVLIFVVGVYLATLVRSALRSVMKTLSNSVANIIATVVFYIIVVFISITALEQAGVNTNIITSNVTLIFGSVLITFTLSFGLGSREVIHKLLLGFYTKKVLSVGDVIEFDGKTGMVISIDSIYLVLDVEGERIVYPIKDVSETSIKIKK